MAVSKKKAQASGKRRSEKPSKPRSQVGQGSSNPVIDKKSAKKSADRSRGGRPPVFNDQTRDTICERLAKGESLNKICSEAAMPSMVTVFKWLGENEQFANKYARAREEQAEKLVDEIIEIADEDPATIVDKDGISRIDNAAVQHQRMRLDARKWVAAKLKPKSYGDKIDLNHGGQDGNPIVYVTEAMPEREDED